MREIKVKYGTRVQYFNKYCTFFCVCWKIAVPLRAKWAERSKWIRKIIKQ